MQRDEGKVPGLAMVLAGLALGAAGGGVFYALSLPLPWMLGALFVTMAASIADLPVRGPTRLRPAIVAVIGVLLGSRFTPAVVDQAGQMLGVIPTSDAQRLALEAGLDLVEVAPNERPPVCRIMDYGKFKYEQ